MTDQRPARSASHPLPSQRRRRSHRPPPGSPPGTLAPQPEAAPTRFRLFRLEDGRLEEQDGATPEQAAAAAAEEGVAWIDVTGLGDIEALRRFAEALELHGLVLADMVHAHQRPKLEPYDDHLFLVTRLPRQDSPETDQLALILGEGFLITLAERDSPGLEQVRVRLRVSGGRLRRQGADYLAYALLDASLDGYFPLLERLGSEVETLEERLAADGNEPETLRRLHRLRRDLLACRRAVWPQRDLFAQLLREDTPFVQAETRPYLRDCYDHAVQLIDLLERDRELVASLQDLQLSLSTARSNDIMKVLTIIATIFIPLGWIAGVYGMNFAPEASPFNMPELGWAYGYPFALGLMALCAGGLLLWFRRRRWL